MSKFYIKNGEAYISVDMKSIISKELNDKIVVMRIGTDESPATMKDIDIVEETLSSTNVLKGLDNVSIILTPHQIEVDLLSQSEQEDKSICLQISSGDDIGSLEKSMQAMYKRLRKRFKGVTILPSPLKIKDYNHFVETMKRSVIRRNRRRKR